MPDRDRKWLPEHLTDEVSPPGRASPDAWIIGRVADPDGDDDLWRIGGWEADDEPVDDTRRDMRPGEVVTFVYVVDLGEVDVTIDPDGGYAAHGPVPAEATHFWERGDTDTLACSLTEFADCYAENTLPGDLPDRIRVRMAQWSGEIPHRLLVEVGQAHFVPVAVNREMPGDPDHTTLTQED